MNGEIHPMEQRNGIPKSLGSLGIPPIAHQKMMKLMSVASPIGGNTFFIYFMRRTSAMRGGKRWRVLCLIYSASHAFSRTSPLPASVTFASSPLTIIKTQRVYPLIAVPAGKSRKPMAQQMKPPTRVTHCFCITRDKPNHTWQTAIKRQTAKNRLIDLLSFNSCTPDWRSEINAMTYRMPPNRNGMLSTSCKAPAILRCLLEFIFVYFHAER